MRRSNQLTHHAVSVEIAQFAEVAKPLCSIAVTSQIVNYASLKHRPPHFDTKKKEHYYTPMELAHFVDANDWRLGAGL
jgi:hypothetical protein